MSGRQPNRIDATPATMAGLAAIFLALVLSFFRTQWAAIPLALFVLACLVAPFCPAMGFFLPVIGRGTTGRRAVSLTFDDGPHPETTRPILELLERHAVKAAFFVTGENAAQYGDLVSAILDRGHEIGNHSYHHDPFLMLRGSRTIHHEIASVQETLLRFGVVAKAFRPPVGITNPKLGGILRRLGLDCVTFSCRANDFGNRRIDGLARKILQKVKPDDIILLHDVPPPGQSDIRALLNEVDLILSGLKDKGLRAIPLGGLIGRPLMIQTEASHDPCIKKY